MLTKFIAPNKIEVGVKKEELELQDYRWEDNQKLLTKKKRNRHKTMRNFAAELKVNCRCNRAEVSSACVASSSLIKNFDRTLERSNAKLKLCFIRLMLKRLAAA
jgi:hypothetical protein